MHRAPYGVENACRAFSGLFSGPEDLRGVSRTERARKCDETITSWASHGVTSCQDLHETPRAPHLGRPPRPRRSARRDDGDVLEGELAVRLLGVAKRIMAAEAGVA